MRRFLLPLVALFALGWATIGNAISEIALRGDWPKSWPAELEPLRAQSCSLRHATKTRYLIPFTDREKFEAAWPHLLSVAGKDVRLTLSSEHKSAIPKMAFDAGVIISSPNTGQRITFKDKQVEVHHAGSNPVKGGEFLTVGPPWPDEIRDKSGKLPEYVVAEGYKWRAVTLEELKEKKFGRRFVQRARIEITLIVDGKIVDLNRIKLPSSVTDNRFDEKPPQ